MPANYQKFTVPAGARDVPLQFISGARTPLTDLRFVFSGRTVLTSRIQGTNNGTPDVTFQTPADPFVVTVTFAQNPLATSDSADFVITVTNPAAQDEELQIGALSK